MTARGRSGSTQSALPRRRETTVDSERQAGRWISITGSVAWAMTLVTILGLTACTSVLDQTTEIDRLLASGASDSEATMWCLESFDGVVVASDLAAAIDSTIGEVRQIYDELDYSYVNDQNLRGDRQSYAAICVASGGLADLGGVELVAFYQLRESAARNFICFVHEVDEPCSH